MATKNQKASRSLNATAGSRDDNKSLPRPTTQIRREARRVTVNRKGHSK